MRALPSSRLLLATCLVSLLPVNLSFSCLGEKLDTPACGALGQLYETTGGNWSWKEKDGWELAAHDVSTDACTFFGVTCIGGELVRLNLFNNGLRCAHSSVCARIAPAASSSCLYSPLCSP